MPYLGTPPGHIGKRVTDRMQPSSSDWAGDLDAAYAADYIRRLGLQGRDVLCCCRAATFWVQGLLHNFSRVILAAPDEAVAEIWRREFADHASVEVVEISGDRLPLPDGTLDAVFAFDDVLGAGPVAWLGEIGRTLKPQGAVYLSYKSVHWYLAVLNGALPDEDREAAYWICFERLLSEQTAIINASSFAAGSRALLKVIVAAAALSRQSEHRTPDVAIGLVPAVLRRIGNRLHLLPEDADFSWPSLLYSLSRAKQPFPLRRLLRGRLAADSGSTGQAQGHQRVAAEEPPRAIETAARHAGLDLVGTGPEGSLIATRDAIAVRPPRAYGYGIVEELYMKTDAGRTPSAVDLHGQSDMPAEPVTAEPDFFLKAAGRVVSAYSHLLVSPRVVNIALPDAPDLAISRLVQKAVDRVGASFLHDLSAAVVADASEDEDVFRRLYRFLQDALFHHPTLQLLETPTTILTDPRAILLSGIARCGHAAHVAKAMYEILGFEARIRQLHKHVTCEVRVDNAWRIVDCDAFKGGVWPLMAGNVWASVDGLRDDPARLDMVPAVGLQLDPSGAWARTRDGECITGYVDTGLAWDRYYLSYLYYGGKAEKPPRPPQPVDANLSGRNLTLRFNASPDSTATVAIRVSSKSRGWSYSDLPGENYLRTADPDLGSFEFAASDLRNDIVLPLSETRQAPLYLNLYATDDGVRARQAYVWPGHEMRVE